MRRDDWHERLHAELERARTRVFSWGDHDCALFVARCFDAMCGTETVAEIREHYHDEPSGRVWLASEGFPALITRWLGEPMPNPRYAQPGDVVLFRNALDEPTLGIIVGHQLLAAEGVGFSALSPSLAVMAWRV